MNKITFPNKSPILYNSNSDSFVDIGEVKNQDSLFEWKTYSTDNKFLTFLADKYNLELVYLGESFGSGYVSDGKKLSVFCKGSSVDEDYMITTLYREDYKL